MATAEEAVFGCLPRRCRLTSGSKSARRRLVRFAA
jgi:hypothetical protein